MWLKYLVVAFTIIISSNAFSQTILQDQLDNVIVAPNAVTSLYTKDLNNDNFQELIAITSQGIYVYNGNGYAQAWASPLMIRPSDLNFIDLDNNGFLDIAARDSLHVYLFNIWNNTTIWTSPQLDSTFKCYTVGDRNDDGQADVIIVRKEYFSRSGNWNNLDTVWINLYDGPSFQQQTGAFILVKYAVSNGTYSSSGDLEYPVKVDIHSISGANGQEVKIILFLNRDFGSDYWGPGPDMSTWYYTGNIRLIDPVDFSCISDTSIGRYQEHHYYQSGNQLLLNMIGYVRSGMSTWGESYHEYLAKFSADSFVTSNQIWGNLYTPWTSYFTNDITSLNQGDELCFSSRDSIYLFSLPQAGQLWAVPTISCYPYAQFLYHNPALFNVPQVVCRVDQTCNQYRFYNSTNGILRAFIPKSSIPISNISDLDNDLVDEIISTHRDSILISSITQVTGINDKQNEIPDDFVLSAYPNPFNTSTTISIANAPDAEIGVYDITGRLVKILHADEGQAVWDASGCSSGLYFARVQTESGAHAIKLILIK